MKTVLLIIFFALLAPLGAPAATDSGAASECRELAEKIDRYTRLRRAGGSARQMDKWHRARNKLKQRYRDLAC
jgi:hypothetical protein